MATMHDNHYITQVGFLPKFLNPVPGVNGVLPKADPCGKFCKMAFLKNKIKKIIQCNSSLSLVSKTSFIWSCLSDYMDQANVLNISSIKQILKKNTSRNAFQYRKYP